MKQLFIFLALAITLGSTVGLPAPENTEVQTMDSNIETDIAEFNGDELHELERRAVARCKVSFFFLHSLPSLYLLTRSKVTNYTFPWGTNSLESLCINPTTLFVRFSRFLSDKAIHYGIHF